MSYPYLGEIRLFAGNFAPVGWATCDGQLINIADNTALYQLLGTTYGGDGQQTFALPDLRSRVPVHTGQGRGLTQRSLGSSGGTETVTLIANQLPVHSHQANAQSTAGTQPSPAGGVWAGTEALFSGAAANATLNAQAVGSAGGSTPHDNMMPFQVLTYIIALQGIYPSQT